ncbi:MAG TPA: aminotransferase class V-fold PLP-dependent enzyme [Kofleriaceae bacterium]|nr:aminotransferase class V-fold PLP-dependent enzyme [Kofleriaceae bacterium]
MTSAFPETSQPIGAILAALADARARDLACDGRAFAFIYDAGDEARAVAREAFAACMGINGLDPTVYPSARALENAVVKAWLELLGGPEGAVGTATAGGTESVMLAVKAARDHARRTRPEVSAPAMLLPVTAHACFHKAAHYLGVDVIPVDVDAVSFRADPADARRKMTGDVVLVVGSAPSYAHGVIDPIEELAALAAGRGALMHVDACVGGCVLPFLRESGAGVPAFDFAVEGVTSISLDLHKYGFAPKGASLLLQRRRELRDAQYYACARWTGYPVVNSTALGSKSLAALGAAFAVMRHLGKSGYRERAQAMAEATASLVAFIDRTRGLRMLGRPDMNLCAFTTDGGGDVFELADRLAEHGWHLQVTYRVDPSPAHIHLTIDPGNAARVGELVSDLERCLVDLPAASPPPPALAGLLAGMAGGALDPGALMRSLGIADGMLPARAAAIHRLIDAAPPAAREALLVAFFGELFS